ncbi:MAG: hypothetical protein PHT12_02590 [Patescibacteria group bacterium]|nr:hypothetical protein [Patescibacteria group bacterium]
MIQPADCDPALLGETRFFYDPHPGQLGAAAPLPHEIVKVAATLNGKTMTLREAVAAVSAPGIGAVGVVTEHSYIGLWLNTARAIHFYRIIRFR